jgi:GNAT superfamily N-acetyltransferase
MIRLRHVVDTLPPGFDGLREAARGEGHRMLDTLATAWESRAQRFTQPGEVLLAAYIGDELVGIGGLTLETSIAGAMRMRRFYVAPAHRRAGVGRALATTLLAGASGISITVNAAAGSEAFWESFGFVPEHRDGHTHIRR